MAARTVYLPKDLDEWLDASGVNVSRLLQDAVRDLVEKGTGRCSRCGQSLPRETP